MSVEDPAAATTIRAVNSTKRTDPSRLCGSALRPAEPGPSRARGFAGAQGLGRLIRVVAIAMPPFFIAACVPSLQLPHQAEAELSRAEWVVRPLEEAWVRSPGSRLLLERRAAGLVEQRLTLPNPTSLRGENLLHLRTVTRASRAATFDRDATLAFIDGVPTPFTAGDIEAIQSRSDTAGVLNWAEWTNGAGITCVLALRRLEIGARVLPAGARAIDLVMRNCIHGGPEEALAPVGPQIVAFPATPGMSEGAPLRTLSPLAAPGL
jgi:hypothetical protein